MKKYYSIFLVFISFLLIQCSINEKPEFQQIENIHVAELNLQGVKVKADLLFKNPNIIGVTVKSSDIKVFHDSIFLGEAHAPSFDVNKESEFTVPLTVQFSPRKIIEQKGTLSSFLNIATKKEIDITFTGIITLEAMGIEYDYDLNQTHFIHF